MQTRWLIQRSLLHLLRDPFSMRVLIIQAIVSVLPNLKTPLFKGLKLIRMPVAADGLPLRTFLLPTRNQPRGHTKYQLSHISQRHLHQCHLPLLCGQRKSSIFKGSFPRTAQS